LSTHCPPQVNIGVKVRLIGEEVLGVGRLRLGAQGRVVGES
jgi:hypothetical protein